MPKKATTNDEVDPVRSRLAAAVAAPTAAPAKQPPPQQEAPPAETRQISSPPPSPAQANQTVSSQPHRYPEKRRSEPRVMTVNRKFMVTPQEAGRMEETMAVISQTFGSRVSYSQVSRAFWTILAGAEEAMMANPRRGEPLRVPSKGDHLGMAEYEKEVSEFLRLALKRS